MVTFTIIPNLDKAILFKFLVINFFLLETYFIFTVLKTNSPLKIL